MGVPNFPEGAGEANFITAKLEEAEADLVEENPTKQVRLCVYIK